MLPRALALASLVTALVAPLLAATSARAQESPSMPVDGTVTLRLSGPDDPALRDSIRELLARLHLAMSGGGSDADGGAAGAVVARVNIDLSSPTDALVLVTDPSGEVRFRRSVPRDATAAIVREEIAHTVQSAVESALLAARERPAPPPAPVVPPPVPPPAPPVVVVLPAPAPKEQPTAVAPPAPFGLEITTLSGVGPVADNSGPGTRIGLEVAAIFRGALHPSLGFSFLYAFSVDTGPVGPLELSADATIYSLRLVPSIDLFHGRWFAIGLGAGGGIDAVVVDPHVAESQLAIMSSDVQPGTLRVDPMLSATLAAHVELAPSVVFLLSAGLDVDLESRQYDLEYAMAGGNQDVQVFHPWTFRPMVLAGLGFTAFGDGRFGTTGGH